MTFDTPANRRAAEFVVANQKRLGFENVSRFIASQAADTGMTQPLIAGNYSMISTASGASGRPPSSPRTWPTASRPSRPRRAEARTPA